MKALLRKSFVLKITCSCRVVNLSLPHDSVSIFGVTIRFKIDSRYEVILYLWVLISDSTPVCFARQSGKLQYV